MNGETGELLTEKPLGKGRVADKSAMRWLLLAITSLTLILAAAWSSANMTPVGKGRAGGVEVMSLRR